MPDLKRRFALQRRRDFEEQLYKFQIKQVRGYYPELNKLKYSEIDDTYRVREAYYKIH